MKKEMVRVLLSLALGAVLVSCQDKGSGGGEVPSPVQEETVKASKGPVAALRFSYEDAGEKVLNLGDVYEMERCAGSFSVKNVSDRMKQIMAVQPTCDCLILTKPFEPIDLQPGESFEVNFEMNAATVFMDSFLRNLLITTGDGQSFQASVGGYIVRPMTVAPERSVELDPMKDPTTPWSRTFVLKKSSALEEPLVLGEVQGSAHLAATMVAKGDDTYEVTITPKGTLPYLRKFSERVRVPILQPEKAAFLDLTIEAQVAEAVNFAPDSWKIVRSKLEEAGQFTERFAYGEVPGLQEEAKDGVRDLRNMMKKSLLRQHNAVPLKFVKENHDWDDLFAHLEYEVPAGVTLEKIRHPQGIELKITVTKEAFAETTSVQVVPFRDGNRCAPITIQVVD